MGRRAFEPKDFGVDFDHASFVDRVVDEFGAVYRDAWTIDELGLHPREALHFRDGVRRKFGYFDVPDEIILRCIMNARKHGWHLRELTGC